MRLAFPALSGGSRLRIARAAVKRVYEKIRDK